MKGKMICSLLLAICFQTPVVLAQYDLDGKPEKAKGGYLNLSPAMKNFLDAPPKSGYTAAEIAKKAKQSTGTIRMKTGEATGFFVGKGLFVTNHHVIKNGIKADDVVDANGKAYRFTKILADDAKHDVAILLVREHSIESATVPKLVKNLDPSKLRETELADVPGLRLSSNPPQVGDDVYIVGNPAGFSDTFSDGKISAFRNSENISTSCAYDSADLMQYTIPSSGGNSGSAVLNNRAEVVGIHCGGYFVPGEKNENINFAVTLPYLVEALKSAGKYPPQ